MVDITHSPKPTGDTTAKANSTDPTDLGWQFFGFFKKAHPWPHSTKLKSKIPLILALMELWIYRNAAKTEPQSFSLLKQFHLFKVSTSHSNGSWESQFLGRLMRSPGVPKERRVWNSQGRGKDKLFPPSTFLRMIKQ